MATKKQIPVYSIHDFDAIDKMRFDETDLDIYYRTSYDTNTGDIELEMYFNLDQLNKILKFEDKTDILYHTEDKALLFNLSKDNEEISTAMIDLISIFEVMNTSSILMQFAEGALFRIMKFHRKVNSYIQAFIDAIDRYLLIKKEMRGRLLWKRKTGLG